MKVQIKKIVHSLMWLICIIVCCIFVACGIPDEKLANDLVDEARTMVVNGQWRQARLVLDSVHST